MGGRKNINTNNYSLVWTKVISCWILTQLNNCHLPGHWRGGWVGGWWLGPATGGRDHHRFQRANLSGVQDSVGRGVAPARQAAVTTPAVARKCMSIAARPVTAQDYVWTDASCLQVRMFRISIWISVLNMEMNDLYTHLRVHYFLPDDSSIPLFLHHILLVIPWQNPHTPSPHPCERGQQDASEGGKLARRVSCV